MIVSMNGIDHRGAAQRSQAVAQLERDAALGRVGRTRRWLIAGAAGLTAAFAALVSAVAPGRTVAARSQPGGVTEARTSSPSASSTAMPPPASPSRLGLRSPEQPPQAASLPPPAASVPPQAPSDPSQAAPPPTPAPAPVPAPAVSGGS